MFRLVAMCCAIATFTFEAPRPAAAAVGDTTTYDTVDAVEVMADQIRVTGIISGQAAPSTQLYRIVSSSPFSTGGGSTDTAASRCDRLALLAISRPGKYQFATVQVADFSPRFSCKLIVRTP
jgi:hypothetical protein